MHHGDLLFARHQLEQKQLDAHVAIGKKLIAHLRGRTDAARLHRRRNDAGHDLLHLGLGAVGREQLHGALGGARNGIAEGDERIEGVADLAPAARRLLVHNVDRLPQAVHHLLHALCSLVVIEKPPIRRSRDHVESARAAARSEDLGQIGSRGPQQQLRLVHLIESSVIRERARAPHAAQDVDELFRPEISVVVFQQRIAAEHAMLFHVPARHQVDGGATAREPIERCRHLRDEGGMP